MKSEVKSEEQMTPSDVVHPRKRKLKMKEPEMENPLPVTAPEQPVTNCYEMFLKIRKQVSYNFQKNFYIIKYILSLSKTCVAFIFNTYFMLSFKVLFF